MLRLHNIGWSRSLMWAGVALVGAIATLNLMDAGPTVRYQHFRPWNGGFPLFWPQALLLLETGVVWIGIRNRWAAFHPFLKRTTPWRVGSVLGTWLLVSATIGRPIGLYPVELVTAFIVQLTHTGAVILAVLSIPRDSLLRVARETSRRIGRFNGEPEPDCAPGPWIFLAATGSALIAALLAVLVYQAHPHIADEAAYLLQAASFARGLLTEPLPPVPEAFELYLRTATDAGWFVVVPPGWSAVLAVGSSLGLPWLVNPFLAGLNVILAFLILRGMLPAGVARLGAILLAASPWHLFLGMSFMPHQLTLTCALVAGLGVERARHRGTVWPALLGGLGLGWAGVTRPLDGLIAAVGLGLWSLGLGGRRLKLSALSALILGSIAVGSLHLVYNRALTGKASTFPIMAYSDAHFGPGANGYGFGPNRGAGWEHDPRPGHDVIDGMLNTELNLTTLHTDLFGWETGSLVPLFLVLLLPGGFRRSANRALAGFAVLVVLVYFGNYFSGGPDFGPRYWHLLSLSVVALTAGGLVQFASDHDGELDGHALGGSLAAVALVTLLAFTTYVPWRSVNKYFHYRGMRPEIRSWVKDGTFDGGLVLIEGEEFPDYAGAVVYGRTPLHPDRPVIAWDRSPEIRARLLTAYPDRPVWMVEGPSRTGDRYRIRGSLGVSERQGR